MVECETLEGRIKSSLFSNSETYKIFYDHEMKNVSSSLYLLFSILIESLPSSRNNEIFALKNLQNLINSSNSASIFLDHSKLDLCIDSINFVSSLPDFNSSDFEGVDINYCKNLILQRIGVINELFLDVPKLSSFSLIDMFKNITDFYNLDNNNIKFNYILDSSSDVVESYFPFVDSVVSNIVRNGIHAVNKYNPGGVILAKISANDQYNIFSIFNDGGKIPDGIFENIFNNHYTTKKNDGGSGLGLYQSKFFVENLLKGKFYAENLIDGPKFILELPKRDF